MSRVIAFKLGYLVGALEGLVDPADDLRDRTRWIERLIGIHLTGIVGVGGNLPAGDVDRLEPGLDLLKGLVAGQRAKRPDQRPLLQEAPQALRSEPREAMLDLDRATKMFNVGRRTVAADSGEPIWEVCQCLAPSAIFGSSEDV